MSRPTLRNATGALASLLLSVALGCGGDYPLAPVSGRVTLDGEPLADAHVTFTPTGADPAPASIGETDAEGRFTLVTLGDNGSGAVPGEHRVTVVTAKPQVIDERSAVAQETVPARFRNGSFTVSVPQEGTDEAHIVMTNNTPARR